MSLLLTTYFHENIYKKSYYVSYKSQWDKLLFRWCCWQNGTPVRKKYSRKRDVVVGQDHHHVGLLGDGGGVPALKGPRLIRGRTLLLRRKLAALLSAGIFSLELHRLDVEEPHEVLPNLTGSRRFFAWTRRREKGNCRTRCHLRKEQQILSVNQLACYRHM